MEPHSGEETNMSVLEIESAITQLPPQDVVQLMTWFQNYHQQMWDRQIEDDLETGRLDKALAEVDQEYKKGLARPL
jgi:hypothetical protein